MGRIMTYQLELELFRQAMLTKSLSVADLSERCGVSTVAINTIIKGGGCKAQTAHKIATALDIPVTDLFK